MHALASSEIFLLYYTVCLEWSDLNVKKTKEMLIDFRKAPTIMPELFIGGVKVETVTEHKYLGTVLDNKLNFNKTLSLFTKRCQPRILCLQKLKSFNVNAAVLPTLYPNCIESVFNIFVPVLVWRLKCEKQKCPE